MAHIVHVAGHMPARDVHFLPLEKVALPLETVAYAAAEVCVGGGGKGGGGGGVVSGWCVCVWAFYARQISAGKIVSQPVSYLALHLSLHLREEMYASS
jgi:hypothetical protein